MTPHRRPTSLARAALARGALALAAALTTAILATAVLALEPASAHNRELSTTPGSGDVVEESPPTIDIVVNADLSHRGATLALTDPTGQSVRLGPVVVDKARISASVPPLTTAGTYQVTYRVSTVDGHAVSATYAFTLSTRGGATLADRVVGIAQGALAAAAVLLVGTFLWRWRRRRADPSATAPAA